MPDCTQVHSSDHHPAIAVHHSKRGSYGRSRTNRTSISLCALALDESEYTPPDPDQAIPLDQPGPTAITQDRREAYRREFRERQQQAGRPLRNQPPTSIDAAPRDATVPLDVAPDSDLAQTLPVDTGGGVPPQFNPYIAPAV